MTYSDNEPKEYESFFNKFKIFDNIKWNKELIDYTIYDIVWGIAQESINYAEIKFSITKYLKTMDISAEDLVVWITLRFEYHASKFGIEIDLIIALKHEMDHQTQLKIANLIKDDKVAECLSGIDIVGNENYFDVDFYKPIFDMWDDAGKACMLHVGEIYNPKGVKDALDKLKVNRICHGIAAADDKELAKYTRDNLISFDICPTSNMLTGVANLNNHPVKRMLENGFIITVGTDDPVILGTNLDREYEILQNITGLNNDEIKLIKSASFSLSARKIVARKQK